MPFIDFQALKERVSIEDVVERLGLSAKETNGQIRAPCPACNSGGDRALVVTPAKQAFYCFASRKGGDLISLVAHVHECSVKDAAAKLTEWYSTGNSTSDRNGTCPEPEERTEEGPSKALQPLEYLLPDHEAVQSLGVSPETCEHFGAGYAPKGIMRGRLAIPIHDLAGTLVAYCGRAVTHDQSPVLIFPKGFRPELYVFNLHQVEGELYSTNDPLDVLLAYENGIDNMVSFLHRPTNVVEFKKRA